MLHDTPTSNEVNPTECPPARLPWEAPVIVSGEAFERVQLASGCDSGIFDGCEVPCDA
jgi:hypothetical protein